jgi:hypothetical protein
MMIAERGARVLIDERYNFPISRGTIVGITTWRDCGDTETMFTVRCDFDGNDRVFLPENIAVTMCPSDSAERMAGKWTIDQCLEAAEALATVPTSRGVEIYQAALIIEFYKLYAYTYDVVRYDHGGWVSGPCS